MHRGSVHTLTVERLSMPTFKSVGKGEGRKTREGGESALSAAFRQLRKARKLFRAGEQNGVDKLVRGQKPARDLYRRSISGAAGWVDMQEFQPVSFSFLPRRQVFKKEAARMKHPLQR